MIGLADVLAAAERIAGRIIRTPTLYSDAVSRATGAEVTLKLENLQAIGSFKERGAANKLALLSAAERRAGVIAMSAGNHAQAVARHASLAGIASTIVMPRFTPATKVSRTAAWGAPWCCTATPSPRPASMPVCSPPEQGLVSSTPMTTRGHGRPGHSRARIAAGRARHRRAADPRRRRRHDRRVRGRGGGDEARHRDRGRGVAAYASLAQTLPARRWRWGAPPSPRASPSATSASPRWR